MRKRTKRLTFGGMIVLVLPIIVIYFLSTKPVHTFDVKGDTAFIISMKHTTDKEHICTKDEVKEFLAKQSENNRKHLRKKASMCGSRQRVPLRLIVWMDGNEIINTQYLPAGFHQDGAVFIYEKFLIPMGKHTIKAAMRDSKAESGDEFNYNLEETVELVSLQVLVLDFDETEDRLKLI